MNVSRLLDEDIFQHRDKLLTDIMNKQADPVKLAAQWESLGCEKVIFWLMRIYQDLVRLKLLQDKADITNEDLQSQLIQVSEKLDLSRLLQFYQFLQQKYQQATAITNYNSLSLLEEIIIYWNNPSQVPQ